MRVLIGVEARRFLARRLVRVFGGLVLVGILMAGVILFVRTHRAGPAEFPDPGFHLERLTEIFPGLGGELVVVFVLLGASFVGAEWHAGTMATQLTWEPRRGRVLAAKVLAAGAVAFAATVVALILLGLVVLPSALFHGTTAGTGLAWAREVAGTVLRAGVASALAAAIGCALASIGRNTAAAAGGAFAYIAVIEPLLRTWKPKWQPWFVYDNVATFIQGHALGFTVNARSALGSGLVLTAYAAGLCVVAGTMFVRRDVN